jgi:hypothetical protein
MIFVEKTGLGKVKIMVGDLGIGPLYISVLSTQRRQEK